MPALLPEQRDLIRDLLELQTLWDPPDQHPVTHAGMSRSSKWFFQADKCAACILARIGEDLHILRLLRTTLLARRKRGRPRPQLLRWVNSWIDYTPRSEEIRAETVEQARRLMRARRAAREALQPREFRSSEKRYDDVSDVSANEGSNDSDVECEIIEDYRHGSEGDRFPSHPKTAAGESSRKARSHLHVGFGSSRRARSGQSRSSGAQADGYHELVSSSGHESDEWI
jgi:hypothetical protein